MVVRGSIVYSIMYYVQYLSNSSDDKPVEENIDDNCSKFKFKKVQETVEYNCPKVHFSCYLFENSCHKVFQKMCCLLYCMVVRGSIVYFMMYHVQYLSTSSDHKPVKKNIDDNCLKCILEILENVFKEAVVKYYFKYIRKYKIKP